MSLQFYPLYDSTPRYVIITCNTSGAIAASGYYSSNSWPFGIIDLNCTGQEDTVWNCPYNGTAENYTCPSNHDASLICQSMLAKLWMCVIIHELHIIPFT